MKITVITVCFDSEKTIADTLASVDRQTGVEIEHIVVDGASRDATLDVVERYYKPWRKVISEPDNGLYDAMNKGIKLSSGDIVGFINSDDFYANDDSLSKIAAAFADHSIDACYGDLCYVKADAPNKVVRYWRSSPFQPGMFAYGWSPPHPTFFVRRALLDRLGLFDTTFRSGVDIEFMMRYMEVYRITTKYIPNITVMMRTGGTSNKSISNILVQNREIWRAFKIHGLHHNFLIFFLGKLFSRFKQFITRPA